ncbi:MAG: capsular biosynthesis protein [Rhodobacteraceae bacterium]|nr:MAG: capsular biosynthesis protein [Paracoccaceae bacterium]
MSDAPPSASAPTASAPTASAPTASAPVVLLLQGPRSPFLARLADALAARGARVERVLFCPGDALFWRGRPAVRFRGREGDWPGFVRRLMLERAVTDVLGLGDGRIWHRTAFAEARALGVRVHVLEQGYLRPGRLTLEPDRLGGWRPGPGDLDGPDAEPAPAFRSSFAAFAAMDAAHHLANFALGWARYPHYRSHELHGPVAEWAGWARKALTAPRRARGRRRALAALDRTSGPVFLLALQLETDFQVRDHGPPGGLRAALAAVAASFAAHAPPDATLVVKPHPLDPGLTPWRRLLRESPAGGRALWLDGGDLDALLKRCAGVVTVNSTVGLAALGAGAPVALLGRAVYEDLAWRGPLDGFWRAPPAPGPARVAAFRGALARATQLRGAFDGEGMAPGAEAVAAAVLARAGEGA